MSGNARGQLKEEMEGIARNLEWCQKHAEKALEIIADKNPALTDMFTVFHTHIGELASNMLSVYATV